jgi:hypothetical protein
MVDSVSSLHAPSADLTELIPPSHLELDDFQPGLDDRLAYLNEWDPPTKSEWRRATWIVARELMKGIVGSGWGVFAKLEVLSNRKRPYGR